MSENHFRSHLHKWSPALILDVRNSLLIAFLAISDRYATLQIFWKFLTKWLPSAILDVQNSLSMAFLAISDQYRKKNYFVYKMSGAAHFGFPKFTFDRISGHFRSICNFFLCEIFDIMAAVGHFGCPKFTFD